MFHQISFVFYSCIIQVNEFEKVLIQWTVIYALDTTIQPLNNRGLGPLSRKSRKRFGSGKAFVNLRPEYSACKAVFSYVIKTIKIEITAKFRASRPLRFEDTKRIRTPEMRPKSLGTLEKRTSGLKAVSCSQRQRSLQWGITERNDK